MPQLEVYCTVKNCDFWGKNNHCLAEKILIVTDQQAAEWPDSVDAPSGSELISAEAQNCMQTSCKTFRPLQSDLGPVADQRATNAQYAQQFPHQ